ncbi:MAG: TadE/TadG family type IV pilus assembly protein [Bacillota bacterium]
MVKDEKGQSLLEFALVLPILLLLVCGIFDFGRVLYTSMNLHLITQETVRQGGFGKNDSEIISFAQNQFTLGDPALLQVDISPNDTIRKSGDYVTVTLTYPVEYATPLISLLFPSPYQVITDSTIRVE